jgi:hypothetical protein
VRAWYRLGGIRLQVMQALGLRHEAWPRDAVGCGGCAPALVANHLPPAGAAKVQPGTARPLKPPPARGAQSTRTSA